MSGPERSGRRRHERAAAQRRSAKGGRQEVLDGVADQQHGVDVQGPGGRRVQDLPERVGEPARLDHGGRRQPGRVLVDEVLGVDDPLADLLGVGELVGRGIGGGRRIVVVPPPS